MDLAVPPDGILEVTVNPTTRSRVVAGVSVTQRFVRVNDVFAVTNATVQATVTGVGPLNFRNDGTGPDASLAFWTIFTRLRCRCLWDKAR